MSNLLNAVEGFNIENLLSTVVDEKTGVEKKYMSVQNRVLWFRMVNPLGKIVTNILEKNDSFAIVEARVYLSKEDDDKNYVAKGIAQREFSKENVYSTRNIEWAETAAIGRALSLAGFGTQFCSDELNDNGVVDSPIESPKTITDEKVKPTQTKSDSKANENDNVQKADNDSNKKPEQTTVTENKEKPVQAAISNNEEKVDEKQTTETAKAEKAELVKTVDSDVTEEKIEKVDSTPVAEEKVAPTKSDEQQQMIGEPTYTKLTPRDEIISVMTLEEAQNTILDIGPLKGKTMQNLLEQDENKVRWFVDSYAGNNNILKASAKILVDNLDGQAS